MLSRIAVSFATTLAAAAFVFACSSSKPTVFATNEGGPGASSCASPPKLVDNDFCSGCSFAANASPAMCVSPRVLNACCVYTEAPSSEVERGTGLHYFTSADPTVDLGCLATPPAAGDSKTVTLKGKVRLFSSGPDSKNVKIEIYKQGDNGALGALVGQAFTTVGDDTMDPAEIETWSNKCPQEGCKLRTYSYPDSVLPQPEPDDEPDR